MREPLSITASLDEPLQEALLRVLQSEAFRTLFYWYDRNDDFAQQADCLIFDITHPIANRRWRMFRSGSRMAGVIIIADGAVSLPPRLQSRAVVLQKPLRSSTIAWGLRKLARLMNDEIVTAEPTTVVDWRTSIPRMNLLRAAAWLHGERGGLEARYASMAEVSPEDEERIRQLSFDPDDYLAGLLIKALKRPNGAVVRVPDGLIKLNPYIGMATLYGEEIGIGLQSLLGKRLNEFSRLPEIGGDELLTGVAQAEARQRIAIEPLLWLAALSAARGRFPISLDITEPRRLARWPDLPRLVDVPHAVAISALWVLEEMNAFEIATELGIHQRHVFSFVSAAHLLNLFELQNSRVERATSDGGWLARHLASGSKAFTRVLRGVR